MWRFSQGYRQHQSQSCCQPCWDACCVGETLRFCHIEPYLSVCLFSLCWCGLILADPYMKKKGMKMRGKERGKEGKGEREDLPLWKVDHSCEWADLYNTGIGGWLIKNCLQISLTLFRFDSNTYTVAIGYSNTYIVAISPVINKASADRMWTQLLMHVLHQSPAKKTLKSVQEVLCGINRVTLVTFTPCPMPILFLNYKYVSVSFMYSYWARKDGEGLCFQAQLMNSATCCPDLFPSFEVL